MRAALSAPIAARHAAVALETAHGTGRASLATMYALRQTGMAFHAIAVALNRLGMASEHGGRWYGATVRRALGCPGTGAHRCTEACIQGTRACPSAPAARVGGAAVAPPIQAGVPARRT